jgi:hypothetical protein
VARLAPQEITDPRDAANLVLRTVEEVGSPLLQTPLRGKVREDFEDLVRLSGDLPGSERIRRGVETAIEGRKGHRV